MSGQEGTPNGVDRLAQIAERPIAKIPYSKDGTYIALTVEERDTLVEIARAARELCDGGQDLAAPFAALRSALARLAPPTDNQGDSGA